MPAHSSAAIEAYPQYGCGRSDLLCATPATYRFLDAALGHVFTVITGWPLYFDAAQGDAAQEPRATRHMSTLAEVYSWSVMPDGLTPGQRAHVLGGEAALWTERIPTPAHLFYMLLPRELALAEI